MDQASLRSPVTKHFPEQCSSEPGLAVHVEHSFAGDFVCLLCNTGGRGHMKSIFHKAAVEQWRSFAGSLFVLANFVWQCIRAQTVYLVLGFLLCGVESYALWCVARSCPLALVSVRVQICTLTQRVLLYGVDCDLCWFCWRLLKSVFLACVEFIWTQDNLVLKSSQSQKKSPSNLRNMHLAASIILWSVLRVKLRVWRQLASARALS